MRKLPPTFASRCWTLHVNPQWRQPLGHRVGVEEGPIDASGAHAARGEVERFRLAWKGLLSAGRACGQAVRTRSQSSSAVVGAQRRHSAPLSRAALASSNPGSDGGGASALGSRWAARIARVADRRRPRSTLSNASTKTCLRTAGWANRVRHDRNEGVDLAEDPTRARARVRSSSPRSRGAGLRGRMLEIRPGLGQRPDRIADGHRLAPRPATCGRTYQLQCERLCPRAARRSACG